MSSHKLVEHHLLKKGTLENLSKDSGVSLETIRNLYYKKVEDPRIGTVLALCEALNTPVVSLYPYSLSMEGEENLLLNYRVCNPCGRKLICCIAEQIAGTEELRL